MWTAILSFIGACFPGLFGPAINGIVTVEQAEIAATTDKARLTEDLAARQVTADSAAAVTNAQVVIAEQANWFTRSIRPLIVLPFIAWEWQAVVMDKVVLPWFGISHSTDDLGGTLHWAFVLALTSYLGPIAYNSLRKT